MRSNAGMVDTKTNRDEPISTEVPRHLQNSERGIVCKAYTNGVYGVGLYLSLGA